MKRSCRFPVFLFVILETSALMGQSSMGTAEMKPAADMFDRIHGALLGKCVGLVLGQPVEGWPKESIEAKAKQAGCYPVEYYFPADFETPHQAFLLGHFDSYPPNDDTMLMTVSLLTLQRCGLQFTPRQLAEAWVEYVEGACTAEGVALDNFRKGIWPPRSALHGNPYRQWIGSQMRAEIWGMVAPGQPHRAAELAERDASISHVRNGVYGARYVAALVSLAMGRDDLETMIVEALDFIPEHCEYARAVRDVVNWYEAGHDWQASWKFLDDRYGWNDDGTRNGPFCEERFNTGEGIYQWSNLRWVHVTPNGAACVLALLYSRGEFSRGICIATMAGYDADCNAGTVGSVLGAMQGETGIPARWKQPLNDKFSTGLTKCPAMKISEMAKTIRDLAEQPLREK